MGRDAAPYVIDVIEKDGESIVAIKEKAYEKS